MAKPIWTGAISFGLLHIPVQLMPAEKRIDLHFRMLDHRDNARIRYERVNADTGDEVPWKDVVKAFEYEKGSYVVIDKEDLKAAAPESAESVDIEAFVDPAEISLRFYEKPYFLVPQGKSEKGYVLLRETLRELGKCGLARVVIRTREYLALVLPEDAALVLYLIRYPQELLPVDSYTFPALAASAHRISKKELDMARQLVSSMSASFTPEDFRDEFRERLSKTIAARVKKKGGVRSKAAPKEMADEGGGKVVDFMSLLKKSIDANKRTPAQAAVKKAAAKPRRRAS